MSYDNNIMSVPTPVSPNQTKLSYQKLLELADDFGDQLKQNWMAELVLPVIPVKYPNAYVADVLPSDHDICRYLNGQQSDVKRLYFSPIDYPPPQADNSKMPSASFVELKKLIEKRAFEYNTPIICNGGHCNRTFNCGHCYRRWGTKPTVIPAYQEFRNERLVNDRKANRPNGKSKKRRVTGKYFDKKCPFGFVVKWDHLGYYINLTHKSGCPTHERHPKTTQVSIPARLIKEEEKETLFHLALACCGPSIGRNYIYSKIGKYMPQIKIAY